MHSTAGEGYIVPSQGKNVAGGKEFLRAMLSKEAAVNFAKTKLASTIVKGTVPADGFGSTALQSQIKMLEARRVEHLLVELRRPLWHEHRSAGGLEQLPRGRLRRRQTHQGSAGRSPTRSPRMIRSRRCKCRDRIVTRGARPARLAAPTGVRSAADRLCPLAPA